MLVIGAGPAGSVAASIVRQAGHRVMMVEKEKFPRFVIGESLLPRCMEALEEAGLLEAVKAKGFQQKFGAKFVRNGQVCDFNFSQQFTKGWDWTWQVPRAEFDLTLANATAAKGVDLRFQHEVTAIEFRGSDSTTTIKDTEGNLYQVNARFIIDASGYGRVIPRLFQLDRPSNITPRKTLFTHFKDPLRMQYEEPNRILVVDHEKEVWIWAIPFSNGNTSVGFVGHRDFFDRFSGTHEEMLRTMVASQPAIAERFKNSEMVMEPRTIEGWSVTTDKFYGDGFVLTGNVTEFLDPIFSSGVTLAVASSQRAAQVVNRLLSGEKVDWETDYMQMTMQGVNVFRSYVMAWYDGTLQDIFFAQQKREDFMNQICSVLAGYVWDTTNPFVKKHSTALKSLSGVIRMQESLPKAV